MPAVPPSSGSSPSTAGDALQQYLLLWSGLGILYAVDFCSKKAFLEAGIKFPSSLVGMFAIAALLMAVGEKTAGTVRAFFTPALNWIAKWLPIFYVASLVCLPLGLKGLTSNELVKMIVILGIGMVISMIFTAQITVFIRGLVKTPSKEVAKAKKASPFLPSHYIAWATIAAVTLAATCFSPSGLGPSMALPFMLACTIGGFLFGNSVPPQLQGILHPVITTALAGNGAAAVYGKIVGISYDAAQTVYYTKGAGPMGAGDLLSTFLGSVILSMGFRIYDERETMKRHAPEILGATFLSSLFNMFSTVFLAKAVGLQALLARALIPRSVTVALALPIGVQLDAPLSIVAAAVLLHCLLAANFCITLLNAIGCKDTIARGLAAAGTGGGFGTAALTSKEPEAMPFCALSYSMVGIFSTLLATVPQVRQMLFAVLGC